MFQHLGTVTSDARSPFQVDHKLSVEIWPLTRWLQKIHPFCVGFPVCFRSVSYRDINLTKSRFPCGVNHSFYHLEQRSMTLLLPGLCRVWILAKIASPLSIWTLNFSLFETKKPVPVAMGVSHRSMGEMQRSFTLSLSHKDNKQSLYAQPFSSQLPMLWIPQGNQRCLGGLPHLSLGVTTNFMTTKHRMKL